MSAGGSSSGTAAGKTAGGPWSGSDGRTLADVMSPTTGSTPAVGESRSPTVPEDVVVEVVATAVLLRVTWPVHKHCFNPEAHVLHLAWVGLNFVLHPRHNTAAAWPCESKCTLAS